MFLRSLRHMPKGVNDLVSDLGQSIERIRFLQNAATQSSSVISNISAPQLQRIEKKAETVCCAMVDLQNDLLPLSSTASTKRARRAWASIVSATTERRIVDKLTRIGRLDREISAELGMANLDIGYELMYPRTSLNLVSVMLIRT